MERSLPNTKNQRTYLLKSVAWALLIVGCSAFHALAQTDERLQELGASFTDRPAYFRGSISSPIAQSKSYVIKSDYILPNEFNDHVYRPCLKGMPGAFISVGSFRSFTRATYGDFSDLITMDYNVGVTSFNRIAAALLSMSSDSNEFMRLFMLGEKSAGKVGSPKVNACEQAKQLSREFRTNRPSVIANWRLLLGDGYPLETEILKELNYQHLVFRNEGMGALICESYHSRREKFAQTAIGNQELFLKLKMLAENGRITSVNSDVTDPKSFRDLAKQLNARHIKVSAFDISNVPDYLSLDELITLIDNLQMLPWEKNGKVLFTSAFGHLENIPGDHFAYFFIDAKDLDLVRKIKKTGDEPKDISYLTRKSVGSINLAQQSCTGEPTREEGRVDSDSTPEATPKSEEPAS